MSVRDGNAEIYVMNANGSAQRNLTRNAADDSGPSWSPDGKRIYFVSNREGDENPFVMNGDGSGLKRVSDLATPYGDLQVTAPR